MPISRVHIIEARTNKYHGTIYSTDVSGSYWKVLLNGKWYYAKRFKHRTIYKINNDYYKLHAPWARIKTLIPATINDINEIKQIHQAKKERRNRLKKAIIRSRQILLQAWNKY